ncbi:MAG: DUF1697 domain-containing protein [Anaerolineales bacterium]|nr:DUF1697 domain-containing protein [Anaerolineales bacterium]
MEQYIAFLRAINVGGHKVIKMEDLRGMFESYGFANVSTYINSGNVIFESGEKILSEGRIEDRLEKSLGYKVEIFLRTMREIKNIAAHTPFQARDGETVHVVFLREAPDKQAQQALASLKSEADDFAAIGKEIYNLRRDKDKSIFSNNFIEKAIKSPATTRNLTTILKIVEKYGSRGGRVDEKLLATP